MTSTGFAVRAEDAHRLPPAYTPDAAGALVLDEPGGADSAYARAPAFPAATGAWSPPCRTISSSPACCAPAACTRSAG